MYVHLSCNCVTKYTLSLFNNQAATFGTTFFKSLQSNQSYTDFIGIIYFKLIVPIAASALDKIN
jgi:hypothetical protein